MGHYAARVIAAIKTGNADGLFFPEAVICAFMWATTHGVDVVNNSYFADPWSFNGRNDRDQLATWKAEQHAIRFAMSQGVTVVAAMSNDNVDLAHPSRFGKLPPGKVQAIINQTADSADCPPDPFDPGGLGWFVAHCTGGAGYNSFYGHGQVNVFKAVLKGP